MQFPNPPAQDGYYWIDIHGDAVTPPFIGYWRGAHKMGPAMGWYADPWGGSLIAATHLRVRSETIVFAEPKPAEAETPAPPAPAARPPGSAAPNTGIDAIVAEVMGRAVNQEIAAIAVAVVTSEDQILSDHAANPHMRSRLLAGADLLHDAVRQAVRQEAARSTS